MEEKLNGNLSHPVVVIQKSTIRTVMITVITVDEFFQVCLIV